MICGFYGLNIDLFNFRQRFGSPSQGSSLMSLSKTAEHAGLKSRALALDLDENKGHDANLVLLYTSPFG